MWQTCLLKWISLHMRRLLNRPHFEFQSINNFFVNIKKQKKKSLKYYKF